MISLGSVKIVSVALSLVFLGSVNTNPSSQTVDAKRSSYQINLKIDFDERRYEGSQRVKWFNKSDRHLSQVYFRLYSNLRTETQSNLVTSSSGEAENPRLDITRVRIPASGTAVPYSIEDQGATLRINLRDAAPPNSVTELEIGFRGIVPEIDPDETGLTTHVVKQVSAALRDEREIRRARDLNFRSRGVMLLGTFYPVLAVQDGDDWKRRVEPSIGDFIFNESADYEVTVETPAGVSVFTAGERDPEATTQTFRGAGLRDFAVVAGRNLRAEETRVGKTNVRSVYLAEHERVGKRSLGIAADAVRVFNNRFGDLPFSTVNLVEAPLVAGLGSMEFSGFNVIASAFCVDFDSAAVRNLPEIIREQRPAVEQSLEWAIAHLVAHQWWGAVVGSDPAREPVLDEAVAAWSALVYYRDVYGDERAKAMLNDELRGVYRLYRTFGGQDMDANRPARDYRNSLQYEAIVTIKGSLMLDELRKLLGDEKFFQALTNYYQANRFEVAQLDDLRGAILAEAPVEQRRLVGRTFNRWLASKRGDEDIAVPDAELATTLGLPKQERGQRNGDTKAFTAFARLGKFFWQQMTRIR